MKNNGNNVYKFESKIPEDIYLEMLIPDNFKDDIKELFQVTGKSIREIPYLDDMFFSLVASTIHYKNFMNSYEDLVKFFKRKLDESLSKREDLNQGKAELFLGGAYLSIHFFLPLDSLITCVKRTLDFSMRFSIKLLLDKEYKFSSIHDLSKCFIKRNKKLNDINGQFEKNFPEFRSKFLNEWDAWMKKVNEIRDNVLHSFVIKEGAFDIRSFRDSNKDSNFIHFNTKELDNPLEFVELMMKKFYEYFTWIIKYILKQLSMQATFSQTKKH